MADRTEDLNRLADSTRAMSIVPNSWNEDDRTIEVTFSTGARGLKYDWRSDTVYIEDLPLSGMDMTDLNNGASVLRNHGFDENGMRNPKLEDVFGSVVPGSAVLVDDAEARALLKLSKEPSDEELVNKIKDDIVRKWSYGYEKIGAPVVTKDAESGYEVRTWAAHKPFEISATPVPFDGGTNTRNAQPGVQAQQTQEGSTMTEEETRAAALAKQEADATRAKETQDAIDAAIVKGATQEATRQKDIKAAADIVGLGDNEDVRTMIGDTTVGIHEARAKLLEFKAAADAKTKVSGSFATSGDSGTDSSARSAALTDALAHNAMPGDKPSEGAQHFSGMRVRDIAKDCVRRMGLDADAMGPGQLFETALGMDGARAHSTSDFPLILANAANKNFRAAFAQESLNFESFAGRRVVNDFKEVKELQLGNFTSLPVVPEGAEITYGTLGESQETWAVLSYARRFGIFRQALINDDLGAFGSIPARMASAINRTMLDVFWALFTANANLADGIALFHASHANLTAGGAGGAPSVTQIGKGRLSFRTQTDLDGNPLSLIPSHLIFPSALEDKVEQVMGTIVPATTANVTPSYIRSLQPISEPRLDNSSITKWFMASSMWQSMVYGYLAGAEMPRFSSRPDWERQGIEFKIEHDFGAGVTDWRGVYQNAGV